MDGESGAGDGDGDGAVKSPEQYADVKAGSWYYDGVAYVLEKGLFTGTGDTLFEPDKRMTRAMLVTVLYRMEGSPAAESGAAGSSAEQASSWTDVKAGSWYYDAVLWAEENNIVGGYGDGTFGTADEITREQLATILYRYAAYRQARAGADAEAAKTLEFQDAGQLSSWAEDAMKWACGQGLVTGVSGTELQPQGKTTRAQAAVILMRFDRQILTAS